MGGREGGRENGGGGGGGEGGRRLEWEKGKGGWRQERWGKMRGEREGKRTGKIVRSKGWNWRQGIEEGKGKRKGG